VLGGDVHAGYAADLHFDPAAAEAASAAPAQAASAAHRQAGQAAIVASEFCGTSISSQGLAQERVDAVRSLNPHIHHGRSDERGYLRLKLDARTAHAQFMAVVDPMDTQSAVREQARFAVALGQPGVQPG
jgi:alkaline phosphatase D